VAISAEESDAITALNASLVQSACKARDTIGKLSVGEALIAAHNGLALRILLLRVAQETNRCQR